MLILTVCIQITESMQHVLVSIFSLQYFNNITLVNITGNNVTTTAKHFKYVAEK